MSKVDFFALSRPELISETKAFSDPNLKGKEIVLTLRALDEVQRGAISELAEKKILQYCGSVQNEIQPESDFPPLSGGGDLIELNGPVAYQAASLVVMQLSARAEDAYDFEELIALAVTCPTAWNKILKWRDALNKKGVKQTENENGAQATGHK